VSPVVVCTADLDFLALAATGCDNVPGIQNQQIARRRVRPLWVAGNRPVPQRDASVRVISSIAALTDALFASVVLEIP
jgi:hypothetical protein